MPITKEWLEFNFDLHFVCHLLELIWNLYFCYAQFCTIVSTFDSNLYLTIKEIISILSMWNKKHFPLVGIMFHFYYVPCLGGSQQLPLSSVVLYINYYNHCLFFKPVKALIHKENMVLNQHLGRGYNSANSGFSFSLCAVLASVCFGR